MNSYRSVNLLRLMCALSAMQTLPAFAQEADANTAARTVKGLQVLYDFSEKDGDTVYDRSRVGAPIDLKSSQANAVRHADGQLQIVGQTTIRSEKPASRLIEAIKRTQELTVEAWLQPIDLSLTGPARIVTISNNPSERNLTLGQEKDKFDVRLRTTKTSGNGTPSLSTPENKVGKSLVHVVYTRGRNNQARIFLDGKPTAEMKVNGSLSNWNTAFHLGLGNEFTGDRPWKGGLHLVAIYNRALSPGEVLNQFKAGPSAVGADESLANESPPKAEYFQTQVASVLVKRCFECHDTPTHEGGLDLSKKEKAFKGGENGPVIVPGKHAESQLWKSIANDEMPADREPLTAAEKEVIKKWIDDGAVWSLDEIDPVDYAHDALVAGNFVRRLTIPEYIETVKATVGVDISAEARESLPPDIRADGFSNTAYNLSVDLKHINAYAELARIIVSKMDIGKFSSRFTKRKTLTDNDMRALIESMGKWILRGPLSDQEIVTYRGISTTVASAGGSYNDAVAYTIEAMLQAPRFLYRMESQSGDGSVWPVGAHELASRMSYIIWGSSPDEDLMRAADNGELFDEEVVHQHIQRMFEDERAVRQSVRFVDDWLNLKRLDNLRPNKEMFPDWNPAIAEDMRAETRAYFEDVVWNQNLPLSSLLNAQSSFLTPKLAQHYGLKLELEGMTRVDLSKSPSRGGLLTQGAVLTVGGDEASMVSRGLFVLHDLLRGTVQDPPPCVDTTPTPTKAGLTQRGIAMQRLANNSCGGCHSKFEPLAFGLEKFDGLGSYHDVDEHDNQLREDGEILFPGTAESVKYESSQELMDLLAQSDRVKECLTWKATQFALGRPLVVTDVPIVKEIHQRAAKSGGTWKSTIEAIILSDLVQTIRTEPQE